MISGKKLVYNDIFYMLKPHFCPDCHCRLKKVKVSRVVNSNSPEAKNFDFGLGTGNYLVGDVEFVWKEFECPSCKKHLTVNEMKKMEAV